MNAYITRKLESKILQYLESPEILAVVGPRQSGKTTMLRRLFENAGKGAVFLTFEDVKVLESFEKKTDDFIKAHIDGNKYIFIDEFQYCRSGGKILKYIYDTKHPKIIISGSSSVDLTVHAVKYLVGRIFVFNLFPLDFEEFLSYRDPRALEFYTKNRFDPSKKYEEFYLSSEGRGLTSLIKLYGEYAVFGGYPRVVISPTEEEKKEVIKNIYNTYFLREVKDILGLIDDYSLSRLIKSLALQVSGLVSFSELSQVSELSYATLKKYFNFLDKTFISFYIRPFFRNKRKEIVKNPKVYFWDTGLRNYAVENFEDLNIRADAGQLLENAVASELSKKEWTLNFWRTKKGSEIDFVVSTNTGRKFALEVKLKDKGLGSTREFSLNYPEIPPYRSYYLNGEHDSETSVPLVLL